MVYAINPKEVNNMPRRDGTGPRGLGLMAGRGLGLGYRRGFGRGFARGYGFNDISQRTEKELLQEEKDILESRLEAIKKELEDLQ